MNKMPFSQNYHAYTIPQSTNTDPGYHYQANIRIEETAEQHNMLCQSNERILLAYGTQPCIRFLFPI